MTPSVAGLATMSGFTMCSLSQPVAAASVAPTRLTGKGCNGLTVKYLRAQGFKVNTISVARNVSAKATLRGVKCYATQTQNIQSKSSIATIKRGDPKGKAKVPKLDDGNGGFPPFRFGKGGGGGGGGGGGSNYFGGFALFTCVLLLDYLKEMEKNLLQQGHASGDQASIGLAQ